VYVYGPDTHVTRAFVAPLGELGNHDHDEYEAGNREVTAEEANLLYARRLASQHGLWRQILSTMQGVDTLYDLAV